MQKKYNTGDAIKTMNLAADAMCVDGRISQAARIKKQVAETYE